MIKAERGSIDPKKTYLQLTDGGGAETIEVGPNFWSEQVGKLEGTWLVTGGRFEKGRWPHWEMHPNGEELLALISGAVQLTVEDDDGRHEVTMNPGDVYLMSRGVWHIATALEDSAMLFVTAGQGIQHRPA